MNNNPQLQATLARLAELRTEIEQIEGKRMSEERFTNRFIKYSATVWSRVNSGTYPGNIDNVIARLEQAADDMADRLDSIQRAAEHAARFVQTRFATAVLGGHRAALDDLDACRIVVALGPTGVGKSTIAHYLQQRHDAIFVEGRQSWSSSYKAFCLDVAAAAGKTITGSRTDKRTAEDAVIDSLGSRHGTLVIDEANTQSAAIANGIKQIINRTPYVVVLLAVPEQWDDFATRNNSEVGQVINRVQAFLRFDEVPARDVALFLSDRFTGDRHKACRAIARAANDFGAYKTVKRATDIINSTPDATDDDVANAISIVKLSQDK